MIFELGYEHEHDAENADEDEDDAEYVTKHLRWLNPEVRCNIV